MKLLFDQNLSFKLCRLLADIFPSSSQVHSDAVREVMAGAIESASADK